VIADFDGDGRMDFASPGREALTVFDLDCKTGSENANDCGNPSGPNTEAIMWSREGVQGARSGVAVFDFDGDRRSEVVYADQCYMRVFDGRTGNVLFSVPRSSTTRYEYPVVADSDGDSRSELITTSNDIDATLNCPSPDPLNPNANPPVEFEKTHGVTVWKEAASAPWMGSRPVWNQHAYYVTNVNDDGTIPIMGEAKSHWKGGPNTFRQNIQGATGSSLELPDLTTAALAGYTCAGPRAEVRVQVCNRGLAPLETGEANVALVEATNRTNVLCSPTNTNRLAAGSCEELECLVTTPPNGGRFDITVMGDPRSSVTECSEFNNESTIAGVFCAVVPQ
jgi:hypothetical protein